MKKRLNIFCVCMIAAFLLSVSGNVYLIIEMFINGVEVGMKAAQGEITEIPQYKMVHILPTDMMETTGTVTNLKDGRQLAVKPITALVECPYSHSSHGFEVLQGLIGYCHYRICLCNCLFHQTDDTHQPEYRIRLDQRKTPAPRRMEPDRNMYAFFY